MHVMVLGAGLAGVTSAWYLRAAGFEVSVIERREGVALETSFANGGQISVSHPEPWANPSAPATVLRWLGREDAPLLLRPRADPALWRWALAFAAECLPSRAARNTRAIAALALHSLRCLRELREATGIRYAHRENGILHLFRSAAESHEGLARVAALQRLGIAAEACDRARCEAIEPALAFDIQPLTGGLYAPADESGDAHEFTHRLAELASAAGVSFRFGLKIERLLREDERVVGVLASDSAGAPQVLRADLCVLCLGSHAAALLPRAAVPRQIYPVKGYSVTVALADAERAPTVSLTEESRRIVCSRLGERLRIAGTAELNGYDLSPNPVRGGALLEWLETHFPGVADQASAEHWCGLRPATPSNVPLIGPTRTPGLWINGGHGTLGWTLACGSAQALAELVAGRRPAPEFPFLGAS